MSARRARWLLALGVCWSSACSEPRRAAAPLPPKPRAAVEPLFLNEPFELGGASKARCRVTHAKSALLESSSLPHPEARVRPDVRALDVTLHCESARGETLDSRRVLPDDSVLLLQLAHGGSHAARPIASDAPADHLLFDLPEGVAPELPSARRFDAATGRSVVAREQAVAKLVLRTPVHTVEVVLRQRFQDSASDALIEQLALGLARGSDLRPLARDGAAQLALSELTALYAEVRQRFQPARLELTRIAAETREALSITLSLTRPRSHAHAFEVARFALTLAHDEQGALRIASFDNREAARSALACDALESELSRTLASLRPPKRGPTCNALGISLPVACADVEPGLLARALEVGARCGAPFMARKTGKRAPPSDFQLTLRRGRSSSGLDRNPRYVVALFHGGQVVFHGKHWVESQERSDGRTDPALLSGLYEQLVSLDFFARRGGQYDPERCSPAEDQGDVFNVVAGERQRMVLNRDGCRGPFSEAELTELRRQIEQVAGISGWLAKGPTLVDQDAEQWAVAE